MADEQPPRLAICDAKCENSELVGKKTYIWSKSSHLRVRFDETSKPAEFNSVGDGVAYISGEYTIDENINISETGESATLDKLREGVYGWTEGLPDDITWQMQILILPEGYTLQNPSTIPSGAKQFNERLAVFWLLNGGEIPRQTRVVWDLCKIQDDLSTEVQRINTQSYMSGLSEIHVVNDESAIEQLIKSHTHEIAKLEREIKELKNQSKSLQEIDNTSERYVNFDLHVSPGGHATANSNQGQASAKIPTEASDQICLMLESIEKRDTEADLLQQLGKALYDWLFPGSIHTHLHETEAVAKHENAKIRLRLQIEAGSISSLPLEFLYRTIGGYFVATNPSTVLSRYLNVASPPKKVRRREGALHMIAIIANPSDQIPFPPDEWEHIIQTALRTPLENGQMTLQTVKQATRKKIRNTLLKQKPDIIQFVGHGIYKQGKGNIALVDESTGKTWLVDEKQFASLFQGYDDHLGLINLVTCESAKSNDPQGFLGIAPKLVQEGVPAVLAMQYKIFIESAKVFLEDFYTVLAARKPIDWSTQSARKAIAQEFGFDKREFATPVLYMRAQDGEVF